MVTTQTKLTYEEYLGENVETVVLRGLELPVSAIFQGA